MSENISIIVNKESRGGYGAEIFRIAEEELKSRGIRYAAHVTKGGGDATRLASTLCKSTDQLNLIVIGGDGTINETVNGITDFSKVRFAVIPTGSGNDFARELGIDGTPKELITSILDDLEAGREPDPIDIGRVTYGKGQSRCFCISSGIGMDAMACKLADRSRLKKVLNKLHLGSIIYVVQTIRALFTMDTTKMQLNHDEGTENYDRMIFTAAMNFKAEGGGVPMSPMADPRDGKISICLVHGVPKWRTFFLLPRLAMGKHEKLSCFHFINTEKYTVELDHPMALHTDGEYLGDVKEATFECLPGCLRMIGL